MFEVLECFDANLCKKYSDRFCLDYALGDRAFVLYEQGAKGMGVMGLCGGAIVLKKISDCGNAAYREALLRSMLFSISNLNPIQVVKNGVDADLLRFGFTEINHNMTAMSNRMLLQCRKAQNNTANPGGENENGY